MMEHVVMQQPTIEHGVAQFRAGWSAARFVYRCVAVLIFGGIICMGEARAAAADAQFHSKVEPVLKEYCYDCHGDGAHKGNVAFDQWKSDAEVAGNSELWWKALRNLRAGMMPPANKPKPTAEQKKQIESWIKQAVFHANPKEPDPGRVTLRRLNRTEYRNTVRDLTGVDFNTEADFPPDDSGHGFDNISDALTLSPMLLEKYLDAAKEIVSKALA